MKKFTGYFSLHITSSLLVIIYFIMAIMHIVSDSFILSDQLALVLIMAPFILYGFLLDYILSSNTILGKGARIITALLPLGLFVLQIVSVILLYNNNDGYDIFSYLFWIFLSLPLFIVSCKKEGLRQRMLHTILGLAGIVVVYLFLTTQTTELDISIGAGLYFATYFFLIFAASGTNKVPYLGVGLGFLNAVALLFMRFYPVTESAKAFGWDYYFMYQIEALIIMTIALSIITRFFEALQDNHNVSD